MSDVGRNHNFDPMHITGRVASAASDRANMFGRQAARESERLQQESGRLAETARQQSEQATRRQGEEARRMQESARRAAEESQRMSHEAANLMDSARRATGREHPHRGSKEPSWWQKLIGRDSRAAGPHEGQLEPETPELISHDNAQMAGKICTGVNSEGMHPTTEEKKLNYEWAKSKWGEGKTGDEFHAWLTLIIRAPGEPASVVGGC
jgi:hypothetical protein